MARPRKVTAGRMVVFLGRGVEEPALITRLHPNSDRIDLTVFWPVGNGTRVERSVFPSEWRWPDIT